MAQATPSELLLTPSLEPTRILADVDQVPSTPILGTFDGAAGIVPTEARHPASVQHPLAAGTSPAYDYGASSSRVPSAPSPPSSYDNEGEPVPDADVDLAGTPMESMETGVEEEDIAPVPEGESPAAAVSVPDQPEAEELQEYYDEEGQASVRPFGLTLTAR